LIHLDPIDLCVTVAYSFLEMADLETFGMSILLLDQFLKAIEVKVKADIKDPVKLLTFFNRPISVEKLNVILNEYVSRHGLIRPELHLDNVFVQESLWLGDLYGWLQH